MVTDDLFRAYLAAGLLRRNLIGRPQSEVVPTRHVTPNGTVYDLYEPAGSPTGAHILLYGQTHAGEKDVRVVRFAAAHASLGLRLAVPSLPGLKAFDFDMGDLEILRDLIRVLHRQFGDPVRITAFSVGGGLALVAVTQADLNKKVDLLLLFSPHHSLVDVWSSISNKARPDPQDVDKWKIFIWRQIALAYHFQDTLEFSQAEQQEFDFILQNYATVGGRAELFYQEVLARKEMPAFADIAIDTAVLRELSPKGKLDNVKARVLIFHDPYDERYSAIHSERIFAELKQRSGGGGQRLLITPLIEHAGARKALRIHDIFTILTMVGDIFATHRWTPAV